MQSRRVSRGDRELLIDHAATVDVLSVRLLSLCTISVNAEVFRSICNLPLGIVLRKDLACASMFGVSAVAFVTTCCFRRSVACHVTLEGRRTCAILAKGQEP